LIASAAESLELRREAVDPAHDLASPSGILGRRGDESRLHPRMTLEVLSVERGFPKDRADLEPLSRDVVDDLAALVRAERPDPLVEDMDVIAPPAREHEAHRLRVEAEVRLQEVVVEMHDLQADRFEHFRIRHRGRLRQVVRVQVEDEIGPQPALLLHRRSVRMVVVRTRIVGVGRHPGNQEVFQLFLLRETEMPLHDPGRPEHEAELAPAETVREGGFRALVVSVELGPKEPGGGLFRGVRDRHPGRHRGHALKGWREVGGLRPIRGRRVRSGLEPGGE